MFLAIILPRLIYHPPGIIPLKQDCVAKIAFQPLYPSHVLSNRVVRSINESFLLALQMALLRA